MNRLYYVQFFKEREGKRYVMLKDIFSSQVTTHDTETVRNKTGKAITAHTEGDLIFMDENGNYELADSALMYSQITGVTVEGNVIIEDGVVLRLHTYTIAKKKEDGSVERCKSVDIGEMLQCIQAEDGGGGKGFALIYNNLVIDYTTRPGPSQVKWTPVSGQLYTYMTPIARMAEKKSGVTEAKMNAF